MSIRNYFHLEQKSGRELLQFAAQQLRSRAVGRGQFRERALLEHPGVTQSGESLVGTRQLLGEPSEDRVFLGGGRVGQTSARHARSQLLLLQQPTGASAPQRRQKA